MLYSVAFPLPQPSFLFLLLLFQPLVSVSRPYCSPATSLQATALHSCSQRRQVVQPRFSGAPAPFVPRRRWSASWSAIIRRSTSEPCPPSPSRGSSATEEIRKWMSTVCFLCTGSSECVCVSLWYQLK